MRKHRFASAYCLYLAWEVGRGGGGYACVCERERVCVSVHARGQAGREQRVKVLFKARERLGFRV